MNLCNWFQEAKKGEAFHWNVAIPAGISWCSQQLHVPAVFAKQWIFLLWCATHLEKTKALMQCFFADLMRLALIPQTVGSFSFTCTWSKNVHLYVLFSVISQSEADLHVLEHVLFLRLRAAETPWYKFPAQRLITCEFAPFCVPKAPRDARIGSNVTLRLRLGSKRKYNVWCFSVQKGWHLKMALHIHSHLWAKNQWARQFESETRMLASIVLPLTAPTAHWRKIWVKKNLG